MPTPVKKVGIRTIIIMSKRTKMMARRRKTKRILIMRLRILRIMRLSIQTGGMVRLMLHWRK